jgi:hypothetical protein
MKKQLILGFLAGCIIAGTALSIPERRYAPQVESIVSSHEYFREHAAPMYWKISPYYLAQRNDSSCSLATATMVVNAVFGGNQRIHRGQSLATQNHVLERVHNSYWRKSVLPNGNGITLDDLAHYLPDAFKAYGIHNDVIQIVHVTNQTNETARVLHNALLEGERTGLTFIIANFDQKYFTGTDSVGHFAPIGAYDAEKKRVLVMDPDRAWVEPYWVPEQLLLASMNTLDNDSKQYRGYLRVTIR